MERIHQIVKLLGSMEEQTNRIQEHGSEWKEFLARLTSGKLLKALWALFPQN